VNQVGPEGPASQVTQLLKAWGAGDKAALDALAPRVYDELRRMSRKYMKNEREGHTLQTTALVNDVYLRLVDLPHVDWKDRAHFFAMCAQMMRRILVDAARARGARKRGGGVYKVNIDDTPVMARDRDAVTVALDDALETLAAIDPRKVQVIELRYFGGLSVDETAEVLKISPQSVMRDWKLAKAWLTRELGKSEGPAGADQ
jgi:RNA polymerase sigma factor (TIGR02999 family)